MKWPNKSNKRTRLFMKIIKSSILNLIFFYFKVTPTIRKCVSQKEISALNSIGINTKNGCHDIRTAKRRHKLYCFCENDLCNSANSLQKYNYFFFTHAQTKSNLLNCFYAISLFLAYLSFFAIF